MTAEYQKLKIYLAVAKGEFLNPGRPFGVTNELDAKPAVDARSREGMYLNLSRRSLSAQHTTGVNARFWGSPPSRRQNRTKSSPWLSK